MKKIKATKLSLNKVDQMLFQNLSEQQSSNCKGGSRLLQQKAQEFEAELATLRGSASEAKGKIRGTLLL